MSAELIERAKVLQLIEDIRVHPARSGQHADWLCEVISGEVRDLPSVSQDKRIAELEPQAKELAAIAFQVGEEADPFAAWESVKALQIRVAELETTLSLAESRGRQIGREDAAKVAEGFVNFSIHRTVSEQELHYEPGNTLARQIAGTIRNLPTNEVGE